MISVCPCPKWSKLAALAGQLAMAEYHAAHSVCCSGHAASDTDVRTDAQLMGA